MICVIVFRDGLYDLLRVWQEKHMTAGWNTADVLGTRIQQLVAGDSGFTADLTSCMHFTRLFMEQIIMVVYRPLD